MHEIFMLNKACGLALYKFNSKGNLNFEMAFLKLKKVIKSRKRKIIERKNKDRGQLRQYVKLKKSRAILEGQKF